MDPSDAFELGLRSAAPGLFFDTMELVAALSVSLGGFDRLESFVRTLGELQRASVEDLEWGARLCSAAFSAHIPVPRGVDAYRDFLRSRVFEIVNRWSYIADIHTVTRLQAWFYAGFALGRAQTVLAGAQHFDTLRGDFGLTAPLDQMPGNLSRMAQEAARQLQTVAEEDDFDRVRFLFEAQARVLDAWALRLSGAPDSIPSSPSLETDLQQARELIRQVRLDLAADAYR